ncbi:hypothetical protein [Enterobacter sp. KB-221C9]|uniref:hypothetical protein n=1 Tax=Enterobacter sp. KB-221C9 TaxID=3242496 RepID=UPI003521F7F4
MRNYTNQANVTKRISFNGLTIISDERFPLQARTLLTTAKPDEQCFTPPIYCIRTQHRQY